MVARLLDRALPPLPRREGDDRELLGRRDDVERLLANRAGRAENDQLRHPEAV